MALLEVQLDDGATFIHELSRKEPVSIGSHASNTITLDIVDLASIHCRVLFNRKSQQFEITAASPADVMLNNQPIRQENLKNDDVIKIGSCLILYSDDLATSQAESDQSESSESKSERTRKSKERKSDQKKPKAEEQDPVDVKTRASTTDEQDDQSVREWITQKRRPGERDALRSPLVTSLIFVVILLVLVSGGLYLAIGRQFAQEAYQAALVQREQGRFSQAIQLYQKFIETFPSHSLVDTAWIEIGLCEIDRSLTGSSPRLQDAADALNRFIDQHRNKENFSQYSSQLADYAGEISLASYHYAGKSYDSNFLDLGEKMAQLYNRFHQQDASLEHYQTEIKLAMQTAQDEILRNDVLQTTIQEMTTDVEEKLSANVYQAYRRAILRYPEFRFDTQIINLVKESLLQDQKAVREVDLEVIDSPKQDFTKVIDQEHILIDQSRSRFDYSSNGQVAYLLGDEHCYGLDWLTGQIVWRINQGSPQCFEPMQVPLQDHLWLVPIRGSKGIAMIEKANGKTVWKKQFPFALKNKPTIIDELLYVVDDLGRLHQFSTEQGAWRISIELPVPLASSVTAINENQLVAIGEQDLIYLLDRRSLNCDHVFYYGHAAGQMPYLPVSVGANIIAFQNDRLASSAVVNLPIEQSQQIILADVTKRLPGQIMLQPLLWGNSLFVTSSQPAISLFGVSDDPLEELVVEKFTSTIPVKVGSAVRIKPLGGEQLWVSGNRLSDAMILSNALKLTNTSIELPETSQEIQVDGNHIVVAGQTSNGESVTATHLEMSTRDTFWRTSVGGAPRLLAVDSSGQYLRAIDAKGHQYRIEKSLSQQNVLVSAEEDNLSRDHTKPSYFRWIPDGELDVLNGNSFFSFTRNGKLSFQQDLPDSRANLCPQIWGNYLAYAIKNRIELSSQESSRMRIDPYFFEDQDVAWNDINPYDPEHLFVLADQDKLVKLKLRTEESTTYLSEITRINLADPVLPKIHNCNRQIVVVTQDGVLAVYDPYSLALKTELDLSTNNIQSSWQLSSAMILVQAADQLIAVEFSSMPQILWSSESGEPLTCSPVILNEEQIAIGTRDRKLLMVDRSSGKVQQTWDLPNQLTCPPVIWNERIWCGLQGGDVVRLVQNQGGE